MSDATRRDALKRLGALGLVVGGAAATAKLAYDPGGFGLAQASGERQVRDFRIHHPAAGDAPVFAIAKSSTDPAELVRRAVHALGGMKRFVSRGDIVAVKPNIGWDRMPVHAANTNPQVVAEVVKLVLRRGRQRRDRHGRVVQRGQPLFSALGHLACRIRAGRERDPALRAPLPRSAHEGRGARPVARVFAARQRRQGDQRPGRQAPQLVEVHRRR